MKNNPDVIVFLALFAAVEHGHLDKTRTILESTDVNVNRWVVIYIIIYVCIHCGIAIKVTDLSLRKLKSLIGKKNWQAILR